MVKAFTLLLSWHWAGWGAGSGKIALPWLMKEYLEGSFGLGGIMCWRGGRLDGLGKGLGLGFGVGVGVGVGGWGLGVGVWVWGLRFKTYCGSKIGQVSGHMYGPSLTAMPCRMRRLSSDLRS